VRLRLTIAYDGTAFRGWAVQPGLRTVEGVLSDALGGAYAAWEGLQVAGRTDTGVHALANVASVDAEGGPPWDRATEALNASLPGDVAIVAAEEAAPDFHARYSARARSYRYRIWRSRLRSPFERDRSWWYPKPLDVERLQEAAALLPGKRDFSAFTPAETHHKHSVRTIQSARWVEEGDALVFEVTADSFLRHMVRSLVGTMVDGYDLEPLLDGSPREDAGRTAPPHGLYLVRVAYD
jgi:tRNA pseudouridine38-40 synthase